MKFSIDTEPRRFLVGRVGVELSHVADLRLDPNEVVTFVSGLDREYDVTAKDWGYYATPSVGGRLRRFGMRAGLMRNVETRQVFVVIVFDDRLDAWQAYLDEENEELIVWLDDELALERLKVR